MIMPRMSCAHGIFSKATVSYSVFILLGIINLVWGAQIGNSQQSPFRVLHYTSNELLVEFVTPPFDIDTIQCDDGRRCILFASDLGATSASTLQIGSPMSLQFSTVIALPPNHQQPTIEIVDVKLRWHPIPIAPSPFYNPSTGEFIFKINDSSYNFQDQPWVQLESKGIARGVPIGYLRVRAADYDGLVARTRIIERCTLRIRFQTSHINFPEGYDYDVRVINAPQLMQWITKGVRYKRRRGPVTFNSSSQFIKVTIDQEGVYVISAEQLAQIGVTIPKELVHTIKLFGFGGRPLPERPTVGKHNSPIEQPLIVEQNSDGSLRAIIFYGAGPSGFTFNTVHQRWERYINPYTTTTSYLLTWEGSSGLRAVPQQPPQQEPTVYPQYFFQRILIENERINAYGQPSGRRWFGEPFDQSMGIAITQPLPGLAINGPGIEYTINVAHKSTTSSWVRVTEHGITMRSIPLGGMTGIYTEYASVRDTINVPMNFVASDQRAVLRLVYQNPSSSLAIAYLDYIEIKYPALLIAQNNSLHIYTEPTDTGIVEYSLSGFSTKPLCFEVTDPVRPQLCTNLSVVSTSVKLRVELDSSQRVTPKHYFISSDFKRAELSRINVGDARNPEIAANMIVITPMEFYESAKQYANYRRSTSQIEVAVIPLEHIYAAFASGMTDPSAIRDFISFAYFHWQKRPRYVLFWGDGHYDYRNIVVKVPNWIPPYENDNVDSQIGVTRSWSYADDSYATEDFFVRVDGDDDVVDLALGRLPITSNSIGFTFIKKIRAYETQSHRDPWQMTITLVADDGPTSGGRTDRAYHINSSESVSRVIASVMPAVIQRKIYLPEFLPSQGSGGSRKPAATEAMVSLINGAGTLILNWLGHGNPRVWAHEEVFDRDKTIPLLRNHAKNFFVVAATCDFSRFDLGDIQSGGEELVLWEHGGAIGVFSASRVVYTFGNENINRRFYEELARLNMDGLRRRLGDVLLAVKLTESSQNDWRYFLLGDPALRLHLPSAEIRIDTIGEKALAPDTKVTQCALTHIHMSGSVSDPLSGKVFEEFSGIAMLSLYDADVNVYLQDPAGLAIGDSTYFRFWKIGGMLHRGNYTIINGRFIADFIIPKDGMLSDSACRIHVMAITPEGARSAMGYSRALIVNCIDVSSIEDTRGPTIKLYLDSRHFQIGDVVRSNPVLIVDLWDESAINAAGIGVGHKIEAWLDDNLDGIDLTEFYEPSPIDWHAGSAQRQIFNLSPGVHTVKVRAWDVWNNFSIATAWFYVGANDSVIEIGRVAVYPHPFTDEVNIVYNHNQNIPLQAVVRIYDLSGRQVWHTHSVINDFHSVVFTWDGRDQFDYTMPSGTYTYTIELRNQFNNQRVLRGILVKIQ